MRALLLALLLTLTGCGFHLRGSGLDANLLVHSAYVTGGGGTAAQVRNSLSLTPHITLLNTPATDALLIDVLREDSRQQVLTLTSLGRVSEYRLFYTVNFRARQGEQMLIDNGSISLYRDYTYDDNNVLGKTNEADTLIANMQQDAALQILRRISAASRNAAPVSSDAH
ncbi:LPS-assembly lipoprotein [Andreprevotia lacus DSM 23236]|jgi:LPS-assembly lipoprotein|uniref:LPS-assembly lipoprotein LptE n=1 Tax=Andreprevotia lacus DSM 23236 TaxID=1121001 RepID=A0A1W1XYD6_9NEIS|nr:LPS assembly lipoprotein LptE [Andreprevotia lacus]SMC28970.1 LPS-assembly lipoprotein [Andreprevotia lacus DSM 23236]